MPDITIAILDGGGQITIPSTNLQVVIGPCSSGTADLPTLARNPNTLSSTFGYGPAVQAAAISIAAGATVLFVKSASSVAGSNSAVTSTAWGTSVLTVSGTPFEAYLVKVKVAEAGTIGTSAAIQISLDAGRNYGPTVQLGTAVALAITGTGLTLNFAAGTLLLAGYSTFSCVEPTSSTAAILSALTALAASAYGAIGWGSMHILGARTGANMTTLNGYLETIRTTYRIHTRAIVTVRDVVTPVAYGGAGETEVVWLAAQVLDVSAVASTRIDACAGHYNVQSQYPVAFAGVPLLRLPLSYVVAARMTILPIQELASRVDVGVLSQIVVDPTVDPSDGFVYHDEVVTPGMDSARLSSCQRRSGSMGFYLKQHRLMAATGSVFFLHPRGGVMDAGCDILYRKGVLYANSTLPLVPPTLAAPTGNGMLTDAAASGIEAKLTSDFRDSMIAPGLITGVVVTVDRANNVRNTNNVNIAASLQGVGYVIDITATIGYAG